MMDKQTQSSLYNKIRHIIIEQAINQNKKDPLQVLQDRMRNNCSGKLLNFSDIEKNLNEEIIFENGIDNVSQKKYYSAKFRMSAQVRGSSHQTRMGYMYVLVRRLDNVSVAKYYSKDDEDVMNMDVGVNKWLKWIEENQNWIIYDPSSINIIATVPGSLME